MEEACHILHDETFAENVSKKQAKSIRSSYEADGEMWTSGGLANHVRVSSVH